MSESEGVDLIYEAAVVPELWRDALRTVAALAKAEDGILISFSSGGVKGYVTSSPRFDQFAADHFRLFPDHARTRRLIAMQRAGFVQDTDVFSPVEIEAEPLFQNFLIPVGYGCGAATVIQAPTEEMFIVHVERPYAEGAYPADAIGALDRLRPHLARAALLAAHLEIQRYRAVTHALDAMGLPAAVVSENGKAFEVNQGFLQLMPRLFVDQPSRLACADPTQDRLLRDIVEGLGRAPPTQAIGSIPLRGDPDHPPCILHVVPVRRTARDIFGRASGIIIVTPVTRAAAPTPSMIQGLFDLTPAEAKLAALIAGGARPRAAAQALGITEESARTVLKTIFSKTGVARQAELVGLLCGKTFVEQV